jgi:hypothetical protein
MTLRVDAGGGVREAAAAAAISEGARSEGDPSVAASARSGRVAAPASDSVAASDAAAYGRIAGALVGLTDPLAMMGFARALVRETQMRSQEDSIETQNDRAAAEAEARLDALAEAAAAAKEAEGWGVFAQVIARVAAVIVAALAVVAGAFTGGAGVALAVGLLIVAFGQDLQLMMQEAGVDSDVTNAIGIGATVIGTACTFGASAAGGAAAAGAQVAAQTAAQTASQTAVQTVAEIAKRCLDITASVVKGCAQTMTAGYEWHGAHREIDAEESSVAIEDALEQIDGSVEDVRAFMESYQRVVASLVRASEARDEASAAAARTRA